MRVASAAAEMPGSWQPVVMACLAVAAFLPTGLANDTCLDMYKTAFKGKAPVKSSDVGGLYLKYCKKNMRSSSAKSMDDLCRPIVKKVEDKMAWVPADAEVTPELVCKTLDQIKAQFPDHAATVGATVNAAKAVEDAEESDKVNLAKKAKVLGSKIEQELAVVLKNAGEAAAKELKEKIGKQVKEVLGGDIDQRKEKLISKILETITLGMRGLETKSKQKTDEGLKEWLISESKELAKARKEAGGKKTEL